MARLLVKTLAIIFENVGNNYFQVLLGQSHVWIHPAMSEDGQEYYEYVLLWPDDCFDIKQQPAVVLLQEEIGEYLFKVREESIIGLPSTYILVAGYPSSIDYLTMTIMSR